MNRYEGVLLDRMVNLAKARRDADTGVRDDIDNAVTLLLDCIVDFREPPREAALEDGCGVMAQVRRDA